MDFNPDMTNNDKFPRQKLIEIIENAKGIEREMNLNALSLIVNGYDKNIYHTNPSKFSETISSTGETAYQRAIFSSEKALFNTLGEIVWKDIELPVVFDRNPRRPSIDLIGTLNDKTLVLCELKFDLEGNKADSPVYATIELLIYYYLILDNYYELDKHKVFHKNGKRFEWKSINDKPVLIVGANETYWRSWKRKYDEEVINIESWRKLLPIEVYFYSSVDFNFKDQKEKVGIEGKYRPDARDKTKWTLIQF